MWGGCKATSQISCKGCRFLEPIIQQHTINLLQEKVISQDEKINELTHLNESKEKKIKNLETENKKLERLCQKYAPKKAKDKDKLKDDKDGME